MSIFNYRRISSDEIKHYDSLESNKLIEETNRAFAVFTINGTDFIIGWESDLMNPEMLYLEDYGFLLIGIDKKMIIINTIKSEVYINISLSYLFSTFYRFGNKVIAAYEFEIWIYDLLKRELKFESLPDTFMDLSFLNNIITVKMSDEATLKLNCTP